MTNCSPQSADALLALSLRIKEWANDLGFQDCGITAADPKHHGQRYLQWLEQGHHGEMQYMFDRKGLRLQPATLHLNSLRVISLRMEYRVRNNRDALTLLDDDQKAYVAEYALGRDYHKLMRKRLATLSARISAQFSSSSQRPFVDSAPLLERAYAELSGLGWIGKNTMLINKDSGSWFFLGEILTNLELPCDPPQERSHCGSCSACLEACPTDAFSDAYTLDARKCISYLTIELKGSIPEQYRTAIGNRIFGCDDCQLVCPWNKFSPTTNEEDFTPRHSLDESLMLELFNWTEEEFYSNTAGSPIRRIGYERWLRNLAVGLGNGKPCTTVIASLNTKRNYSPVVKEHIDWALHQLKTSPPV